MGFCVSMVASTKRGKRVLLVRVAWGKTAGSRQKGRGASKSRKRIVLFICPVAFALLLIRNSPATKAGFYRSHINDTNRNYRPCFSIAHRQMSRQEYKNYSALERRVGSLLDAAIAGKLAQVCRLASLFSHGPGGLRMIDL